MTDNQKQVKQHQKHLQELALNDLDAEEVGKVVTALQEEISIIKLQLENLPGYDKGKLSHTKLDQLQVNFYLILRNIAS